MLAVAVLLEILRSSQNGAIAAVDVGVTASVPLSTLKLADPRVMIPLLVTNSEVYAVPNIVNVKPMVVEVKVLWPEDRRVVPVLPMSVTADDTAVAVVVEL